MKRIEIELPQPLGEDLAAEVQKQAVYATREARSFQWDGARRVLRAEVADGADDAIARDKVARLVRQMVATHRALPRRVIAASSRRDRGPMVPNVEELLAAKGFLRFAGPGQAVLSGPPLALSRRLDERIAKLAKGRMRAKEEAYPALIPARLLKRCGYVGSFPHALSMVTHLAEDIDAIDRFHRANLGCADLAIPEREALAAPHACLTPAVCYHFYPSLEGAHLAAPLVTATALGRCFRHESTNLAGLERLWEFEMREVVFCGAEARVTEARSTLLGLALAEAASLDLELSVESANDPFFSAEYARKSYWQTRNDLKLEMKLALAPIDAGGGTTSAGASAATAGRAARSTAAASFNLHEDHFGRTFGFTAEGLPAFSGCAAWGLARWVLAAFAQHGLSPDRWPEEWRADVFG